MSSFAVPSKARSAARVLSSLSLAVPLAVLLGACATSSDRPMLAAKADLKPTQGSSVQGTVAFQQMRDHVMVSVRLSGLAPGSVHGFHVHEKGDCSSPDGNSAGGHFNPTGSPHGSQQGLHHAGDMPNLQADASGAVDQQFMVYGMALDSSIVSVIGRGVIVHAGPDDYATQPTGNSGARLACGVIAAG